MEEKLTCDHCGKKECENCVKMDGRNFCCEDCLNKCKAQETHDHAQAKEPANICKFC